VLLMLLIHETAPTDIYTLSLHDALPIYHLRVGIETAARNIERAVNKALVNADVASREIVWTYCGIAGADHPAHRQEIVDSLNIRSEEHTSELQSQSNLVCRLLLEKKKIK